MLTRARGRLALGAAVLAPLLLGAALQPTSAAWSDAADFSAVVAVGTWVTAQSPVTPGDGVAIVATWTQQNNSSHISVCAQITVSTTSPTPVPWSVVVHTDAPPWNGRTSGYRNGGDGYTFQYGVPTPDAVTVTGGYPQNQTVVRDHDLHVSFCNDTLDPIPAQQAQGWYTSTSVLHTAGPTTACVTTTVTPKPEAAGGHDFFFDWSVPVDLSPAVAAIGRAGSVRADQASWVGFSPRLSPSTSAYQATTDTAHALRAGGAPVSFDVCAYR